MSKISTNVVKLGVKREHNWLYYLRVSATPTIEVWRTPLRRSRPTGKDGTRKDELVLRTNFVGEPSYLYFLNHDGDLCRARKAKPLGAPRTRS